jgi:hypothetical protein
MSNGVKTNHTGPEKTPGNAKSVSLLLLGIGSLLAVWMAVPYLHISYIEKYIADFVSPNVSFLRLPLVVAFGGFALSIPLVRHFSGRNKVPEVKVQPIPQYRSPTVHPLFSTPRPSRDTNFVIRKTKNRGRISRNRAGERLPPSHEARSNS